MRAKLKYRTRHWFRNDVQGGDCCVINTEVLCGGQWHCVLYHSQRDDKQAIYYCEPLLKMILIKELGLTLGNHCPRDTTWHARLLAECALEDEAEEQRRNESQ